MLSIAIDGPAGAGKSSIAREVAKKLRIRYIDSGAMYRAIALKAIRNGIDFSDEASIVSFLADTQIDVEYSKRGKFEIFLDGENVSEAIRDNDIAKGASAVGLHKGVRDALVKLLQSIAEQHDVVMDGRDIGTVVLPNASLKIFLTATPRVRARRRLNQLRAKGKLFDKQFEDVLSEVIERDHQDINREHSPLKQAHDAVLIDSSDMKFDEVVKRIIFLCESENNS